MTDTARPPARNWPVGLARPAVWVVAPTGHPLDDLRQAVQTETSGVYSILSYDPADPAERGRSLASIWPEPVDLIVIGPSARVTPGSILELALCSEPWCMMAVPGDGPHPEYGLGFARFGAALMRRYPVLALAATRRTPVGADYSTPDELLDSRYEAELQYLGIARHHHTAPALPGPDHG